MDNNAFHIRDCGAVGDGVTDDSAAIQAAIYACIAGNGVLHFEHKVYAIAKEIFIDDAAAKIRIIGVTGKTSSTEIKAIASMRACFSVTIARLRMEDILINANNLAKFGMWFSTVSFSSFEHVSATAAKFDGVHNTNKRDHYATYTNRTGNVKLTGRLRGSLTANNVWVVEDTGASGALAASGVLRLCAPDPSSLEGPPSYRQSFTNNETVTDELGNTATFYEYARGTVFGMDYTGRGTAVFSGIVTGATSGATATVTRDALEAGLTGPSYFTGTMLTGAFREGEAISGTTGSAVMQTLNFGNYTINDANTWNQPFFTGNGSGYMTAAFYATGGTGDSLRGHSILDPNCTLSIGNVSVTAGDRAVTGVGTLFRTWGIRAMDPFIIGTGVNKRYYTVRDVVSETSVTLNRTAEITQTHAEFAIFAGDGFHEVRHGDNNIHVFTGGLCRLNAGYGISSHGLYGHTVQGMQFDNHSTWAECIGGVFGPTIASIRIRNYYEGIGKKPWMLAAASGITILEPLLDKVYTYGKADPWDHAGEYGVSSGYLAQGSDPNGGIRPIGGGLNSYIPAQVIGAFSGIAQVNGNIGYNAQQLNVSGPVIPALSPMVAIYSASPQTVTTITPQSLLGYRATFFNTNAVEAITFIAGALLKLRTPSVVLNPGENITLAHLGSSIWREVSRSSDTPVISSGDTGTVAATTAILTNRALITVNPSVPIRITATPSLIAGAVDGQEVTIMNIATNALTLQNNRILAGSNLRLSAPTIVLGQYDSIKLVWMGSKWNQVSWTNVQ